MRNTFHSLVVSEEETEAEMDFRYTFPGTEGHNAGRGLLDSIPIVFLRMPKRCSTFSARRMRISCPFTFWVD